MLMNAPNSLLAMEGFDTMAMMPMPLGGDIGTPDMTPMMPPVIESDHRSEYDLDVYSGCVVRDPQMRRPMFANGSDATDLSSLLCALICSSERIANMKKAPSPM